jgi:hypothetical protein
MYLPNEPFYWNLTKAHNDRYRYVANNTENPYSDLNKLTFMLGSTLYNYTELRDSGYCQPLRKKVGNIGPALSLLLTEPGLYTRVSVGIFFPSTVYYNNLYIPLESWSPYSVVESATYPYHKSAPGSSRRLEESS